MTTHVEGREYDIIFVGGGTAACVAAGRLAMNNPDLSILLIEGGKNNKDDPTVVNPAIYLSHLAPGSQTAIFYKGNAEPGLNGREPIVPSGGMLGGGSSINFMMYTRAQGVDFDSWKTEGWDQKSLVPLLQKLESYHLDDPSIRQDSHGHNGPINISFGTHFQEERTADILEAAVAVGEKEFGDMQDLEAIGGFSRWAKYISQDGKRQDAAHRYIHPLLDSGSYPNLHLLVQSRVIRVLFNDEKQAIGVEYEANPLSQVETALTKAPKYTISAKKLVVVSAGALGTPSVLERSGVGSPDILKPLGIQVVSELPDVGEHYQDHHLLLYPYKTSLNADQTLDALLTGRKDFVEALRSQDKLLGWNGIDIAAKVRPSDHEAAALGPEFETLWKKDFEPSPTRPLVLCGVINAFLGDHQVLNEDVNGVSQYATFGAFTAYPYSRGNIHITSGDVNVPASFNTGFLTHDADLKVQLWAYKKQREIYRRTNSYQGELALGHPKFRDGSKAALSDGPAVPGGFKTQEGRKNLPVIEYDEEDDKAIETHIRDNLNTTWHSCGTCRMAPRKEGGVVDGKLNVYGVHNLKVIDISIIPENVGANTNNTALLIGEKGAEIIAEELALKV